MISSLPGPRRGEIWWVRLDRREGYEMSKTRPALVIGEDAFRVFPLRIVVPITTWKEKFSKYPWMVKLIPTEQNCLDNTSGADSSQVTSISINRFLNKLGSVSKSKLENVVAAVALCIGYSN
jgi:mRNA interferase MazF